MICVPEKIKKVTYPECIFADHESDDGAIKEHWHCVGAGNTCFNLHLSKEAAVGCTEN